MSDTQKLPAIDPKTFWRTLGERATGMTIVTASGAEGPAGFLGLSATHITADPATLLVAIDRKTSALAAVIASRHFAVNYLPATAGHVADAFSGRSGLSGAGLGLDDDQRVFPEPLSEGRPRPAFRCTRTSPGGSL
jgi:flavin reductase (DIM6/NTAB) family NADH-FMN oxidoreductase RutF